MSDIQDTAKTETLHDRVSGIESGMEKILALLSGAAPIVSAIIPGAGPVIAGIEAVGGVVEHAYNAVEGVPAVDSAALAAGNIANSTGNGALDNRLAQIEMYMELASPLLQYIAREFGMSAPAPFVAPANLAGAPVAAIIGDSTGAA